MGIHGRDGPPRLGERFATEGYDFTYRFVNAVDLTATEEHSLIALYERAFNGGPAWFDLAPPLDHLHWKAQDFPGGARAELLEVDDRIMGAALGLLRRFLVRGEVEVIRDGVDIAVDPEWQGRGVQTNRTVTMAPLRKQMFPEAVATWAINTHPASLHLAPRRGVVRLGNYVETHLRLLGLRRLLHRPNPRSQLGASRTSDAVAKAERGLGWRLERARLAAQLVWSATRPPPRIADEASLAIVGVDRFDAVEEFCSEAAAAFDFVQLRDREFLNWRFCDSRGGPFIVRAAEEAGRLVGYCAMRLDRREAVIADLLTLPDRQDVVEALLQDAITLAAEQGAPVMRTWMMRRHPYRAALRRLGFVSRPSGVEFGYEPWRGDDRLRFLAEPEARIHYMIADTDHI